MKGYKWSNGETVNAQDVVFWMNMVKAEATAWAGYAPGPGQFPGDVTNVVANNKTDTVTFTLDATYSSYWFTYNELSQVTPMPIAWDITSATAKPGSGGCSGASYTSVKTSIGAKGLVDVSAAAKACAAVFNFLTGKTEAGDLGTYATNPLWQIVDGPFRLTAYDATDGGATMVPNKAYSGPVKPSIDKFVMAPFTTDTAEFNVLQGGKSLNIGYVPPQNVPDLQGQGLVRERTVRRDQQRSARRKLQAFALVQLGDQLLPLELHPPECGRDLQAALHSPSDAVAYEPEPVDPALRGRLRSS